MAAQYCFCSTDANVEKELIFFFFFLGTEPFCSILIFDGEISGNSDSDEKKLWPYLTTLNGPLRSAVIPVPEIDTSVACQSSYTKVFASGSSFQDVCGEFIGLSQNRPVQRPSLFLTSVGSVSDVLDYSRSENRGGKIKINKTSTAADDRRREADKKRGQSASNSWDHLQCIVDEIMDCPDLKSKTSG